MWQSGVRSCIIHGLPMHLVLEINVGTVRVLHTVNNLNHTNELVFLLSKYDMIFF